MTIDFITIFTDKLEESITFYTDFLGLKLMHRAKAGEGVTLVFLTDGHGTDVELVDKGVPQCKPQNCPIALTIKVDDIYDMEAIIDEKEMIKTFGPASMPSGVKLLHVTDPNGVTINFVQLPEGGM